MADIFKLMGRIVIDASGADGDIDKITKKAQSAGNKINRSFEKIGRAFRNTTKGIGAMGHALIQVGETTERVGIKMARGIAIGTAAISTAAITIGKDALSIRSSIEQGLGGAEAVFKQYADSIKHESENAWGTAGISMEKYLGTANKMGSLFQGSGITRMQAAEMTMNSIQRAADVASIMGIDVDWALQSIEGMAKGNFTMMDNLGVTMTEATLKSYALEKGYEKTWETMSKGEQIWVAYEMFMEKTADYAGNYAKENETAAGSLNTLKAAWSNFLGGVGTFDDLEKSAFGYLRIAAKTLGLDSFIPVIDGAQKTVQDVAEILSMEGLDGRQKFAQIRRYLLEKSVSLASAMGEKIVKGASNVSSLITDSIADINLNLPSLLAVGRDIFNAIRQGIKEAAAELTNTAAIIAPDVISGWFTMKTDFIGIGLDILGAISDSIAKDLEQGEDSLVGASLKNGMQTILDGLATNLPKMTNLATAFIDGIAEALVSTGEDGKNIAEKIGDIAKGLVTSLNDWINDGGVGKFTSAATSFLMGLGTELVAIAPSVLGGFVQGIWDGLTGILSSVTDFFSDADQKELNDIKASLKGIEETFEQTRASIDLATQTYEASMTDLETRMAMAEGHLETIQELEQAATLSPEENEAWKNAVEAIVRLYPELGKFVDAETGKFTINSAAIRQNIADLQALARQKAFMKLQEEYSDQSSDIVTQMVKTQAEITKLEEKQLQKIEAHNILRGRLQMVNNGTFDAEQHAGFNTHETAILSHNLGDKFMEEFEVLPDGSSRPRNWRGDGEWRGFYEEWIKTADAEQKAVGAELDGARAQYQEYEAELDKLNAQMNEYADAYTRVNPAVNAVSTESENASLSLDELNTRATNASTVLSALMTGMQNATDETDGVAKLGSSAESVAGNVSALGTAAQSAASQLSSISAPGVTPNAKGAVFSAPTIFDTRLGRQMVGEAGPEAVAPISVLQNYVRSAVQSANAVHDSAISELASAIGELRGEMNTNMNLYINKKHVASAMSRDMGRSIGNREYALMRGMGG